MKRITPQEVVDAYAKTGHDPAKRFILRPLAEANHWDDPWAYADSIGPEYAVGLLHGFRGEEPVKHLQHDPCYFKGVADGLAAAHAVFKGAE